MHDGQKVGPFQIESEIGSGAMGQVYLAKYIKNGQKVAIKVIAAGMKNSTALARFQREAEVLKQLNHPNIVRFYVVSEFEGAPYYAMEFVEGEPLDRLLERRGKLPWDDVVEFGKQICSALQHAHEQGIIHRDLKPSNLMIMKDGTVKLTDFGIAKDLDVTQLTATNNTVGTASYMSPEQCRGERNLTHKSDLYSLGVVLYELLVGAKPFDAETTMDLFLAHVQGTFERPSRRVLDIPVWLDTLVCQLMEKRPEQRPADAAMVSTALLQVAEKIQAQSSAGVDAVRTRVGDRNSVRSKTDTKDRKAARTLLENTGKKKRKKSQKKRVYEQPWFQAIGLASMLAAIVTVVYIAFQKPKEDVLFQQVQKELESGDYYSNLRARKDGSIYQYLRYYGNSGTSNAERVKLWADDIGVAQLERALENPKWPAESDAEKTAQRASFSEGAGDFLDAKPKWLEVLKTNDASTADGRVLSILAQRHLDALDKSDSAEAQIGKKLVEAQNDQRIYLPAEDPERSAAKAIRYEAIGDWDAAKRCWLSIIPNDSSRASDKVSDPTRYWVILARRKSKEMAEKLKAADSDADKIRVAALDAKLKETSLFAKDRPVVARIMCQDVLDLYGKSEPPDVAQKLAQFQKLLETLPPPKSPEN